MAICVQAAPSIFVTDEEEHFDPCISVKLPVTIKRRGNEMRMIVKGDEYNCSPDLQLVGLVARANLPKLWADQFAAIG